MVLAPAPLHCLSQTTKTLTVSCASSASTFFVDIVDAGKNSKFNRIRIFVIVAFLPIL